MGGKARLATNFAMYSNKERRAMMEALAYQADTSYECMLKHYLYVGNGDATVQGCNEETLTFYEEQEDQDQDQDEEEDAEEDADNDKETETKEDNNVDAVDRSVSPRPLVSHVSSRNVWVSVKNKKKRTRRRYKN